MSTSTIQDIPQGLESASSSVRVYLTRLCSRRMSWVHLLCDQIIISGCSMLTAVFVGRVWGKQQLGLYVLVYSIIVVLLEIQNSFIGSPYTINTPKLGVPQQRRYTGDALVLSISLASIASLGLLLAAASVQHSPPKRLLAPLLSAVACIITPFLVKEFARRACLAHLCTATMLALDAIVATVYLASLCVLYEHRNLPVQSVYWAMGIASAVATLVWGKLWRQRTVVTRGGPVETLRKTWSFGLWVLSGNLALVVSQQLYPWFIAAWKGVEATGVFAVSLALFALINPLMTAVGNYLGPATARAALNGKESLMRSVVQASVLISAVVGLFCIIAVASGNYLIVMLYGSAFRADSAVLAVLAGSVFIANSTLALGFGFWALGRPDINLKINIVSAGSAVILGPVAVSIYGLLGAAWGLLLGNAAVSLIRVVTLRRLLHARECLC